MAFKNKIFSAIDAYKILSKTNFFEFYDQIESSERKEFYFLVLHKLERAIEDDDVKKFNIVAKVLEYAYEFQSTEVFTSCSLNNRNPFLQSNVIVKACRHGSLAILKCFSKTDLLLQNISKWTNGKTLAFDDRDEMSHHAFYYAVRSGSIDLLETLIEVCKSLNVSLGNLGSIISSSYRELKLRQVPLSTEMECHVTHYLLTLQCNADAPKSSCQNRNILNEVSYRVNDTIEKIDFLVGEYQCNEDVDSQFLYTAKVIALNIHAIKRLLKSTYDRLPWEEIEFCLYAHVTLLNKTSEESIFYHAVLSKDRILSHLGNFSKKLKEVTDFENLKKSNLRVLPQLKREVAISKIISSNPEFKPLYDDYKTIRDMHTLIKINGCVNNATSSDLKTTDGQIVIIRSIQVIGEHLKSTLESPKLSVATSELLLMSLPKETRRILADLRNSISHSFSLSKRMDIEQNSNKAFFVGLKTDLTNIGNVIRHVLLRKKMKIIKMLLYQIVDSSNPQAFKKVMKIIECFQFGQILKACEGNTNVGLKRIIEKLQNIIPEKTPYETVLFEKLDNLLSECKETVNDYQTGVMLLKSMDVLTSNLTSNYSYFEAFLKSGAEEILNIFSARSNKEIYPKVTDLLSKVFSSVIARTQNEDLPSLLLEICLSSHMNLKWITELRGEFNDKHSNSKFKEGYLSKFLHVKMSELKIFLKKHCITTNSFKNALSLMADESQLLVLEMLVLDILTITDALRNLPHDTNLLDLEVPVISGKLLRNHLAHDNHVFELLIPDPAISLVSNAVLLATEATDYNVLCQNNYSYRRKYLFAEELKRVLNQQALFNCLEKGDLNSVRNCVSEGADLNGLDFKSCTTLHIASKASSVSVLKYLFEKSNVSVQCMDRTGSLPLHVAAWCGQNHILEFYVKVKALPVDTTDKNKRTSLHYAAMYGHADSVSLLLSLKADIEANDNACCTPVLYAIMHNHFPVVELLLSRYEPEQIDNSLTCLFFASEAGCLEIANHLIKKKHNVNVRTEKGSTPLHAASREGHLDVAKLLISKGSEINVRDMYGCTPLHYAVGNGHTEIVRALVKNGADVNVIDKGNWTPMHIAAETGLEDIVNILLESDSNPKARTKHKVIPLHLACCSGHVDIVAVLLEKGSDVNARDIADCTPLHLAAEKGHVKVIDLLVSRNASANIVDANGYTPLHRAVLNNCLEAVEKLLSYGFDVDSVLPTGVTPLHIASSKNYLTVIECLITHKACIGAKDSKGFTPLHSSAFEGHAGAATLLLKHGAAINAVDNDGMTPLHVASVCGAEAVVKVLISKNADLSIKNIDSFSPLHCAALGNNAKCVKALLQKGSDVNAKDKYGYTPLVYAVKNNNVDIVKLLVTLGLQTDSGFYAVLSLAIALGYQSIVENLIKSCDVNKKIEDRTLLHLAASRGHFGIVECLLKHGADANVKTNIKEAPLYFAAQGGYEKIVEILLAHKANINAQDRDGYTALLAASRYGHFKVVELLVKHGADPNIKDFESRSAVEMAASYGHKKVVEVLIELGAVDLNGKDNSGFSLLHIAADSKQHEMIRYLVSKGCDVHAKNRSGSKPIHVAAREGSVKGVEILLDAGCSVDESGNDNQTLLHYACTTGQLHLIKFMINRGANVNAADDNGITPLHFAACFSHKDAVEVLLSHGAFYNIAEKHGTKPWEMTNSISIQTVFMSVSMLFEAINKNNVTKVKKCVQAGVVIDCKNSKNASPLHIAAWKGFTEIVKVLLKNKCSPNILGNSGNTPLHYACKFSWAPVVEALLCGGAKYDISSEKGKTPGDLAKGSDVVSLLKLVQEAFNMAQNNNPQLIPKLLEIKSKAGFTAVMNARNKDDMTLVDVAVCNNFSKIDQLLNIFQGKGPSLIREAENLAAESKYKKAETLLYRELENNVEVFGEDNHFCLDIQSKIAACICKQGKYSSALKIREEVYQKQKNKFGGDHYLVLKSREAIAFTLYSMGKNDKAIQIYEEVYNKQRHTLGPDHEDTLNSQIHMALVLDKLERYDEALSHNRFVYEEYKKKRLPQAIIALNNVAMVLSHQNKNNEALEIFKDVLKQKQTVFGFEHPDTLRTSQSIAGVLMCQNKLSDALAVATPTLKSQKKMLGPTHPDTLVTCAWISDIYFKQEKYHEAYKLLKEIVELHKSAPRTLDPMIDCLHLQLEAIKTKIRWENGSDSRFQGLICQDIIVAAKSGDLKRVKSLLQKGSDVNERDAAEGRTSLHIAASNGDLPLVKLLLEKGADTTMVSIKGGTPLHSAASKKNQAVVRSLLSHFDRSVTSKFINALTFDEGNSALHEASRNGDLPVVLLLLQNGAKYDLRNAEDETPADAAPDGDVRHFLNLVEDLFGSTGTGCPTMLRKIETLGKEEKLAVFNARDKLDYTLVQLLLRKNHMNLASQLINLFKSI